MKRLPDVSLGPPAAQRRVRPAALIVGLAAGYAVVDVAVSMTLPLLLWPDIDIWIWLAPRYVWHPLEAARQVFDIKFLWLYEAAATGDPAGYHYMPLGPVLFAPVVAIGDALHLTDYRAGYVPRPGMLPLLIGWSAFVGAAAVAAGAWRLAGLRAVVAVLVASKALSLGRANFDLLLTGLLLLAVAASSDSGRGRWTGLALLTKQTAGPLSLPLLVAGRRSRRFTAWAVAAPAVVVLSMVVASPASTLNAIGAVRNATAAQRLCDGGECWFEGFVPGSLIPSTWSISTSWMFTWGVWVGVAALLSWQLRHRLSTDRCSMLAVITLIAVSRPLLALFTGWSEPHHWAAAAVCAVILIEINRNDRRSPSITISIHDDKPGIAGRVLQSFREALPTIAVVAASVVLRYWHQDHTMLSTVDWPYPLDLWGKPWSELGPETVQALIFLAVAIPCAAIFAWPAISVLSPRPTATDTSQQSHHTSPAFEEPTR